VAAAKLSKLEATRDNFEGNDAVSIGGVEERSSDHALLRRASMGVMILSD